MLRQDMGARWRWWLLLTVSLSVLTAVAHAEDFRYLSHQSWSTQDGLPQSSVHAIAQTEDGYLWLATEGGLARFSGSVFRIYDRSTDPAFTSDDLCCLAAGSNDLLWIGSKHGVIGYQAGRFRLLGKPEGLPDAEITGLQLLQDGVLQVTTATEVIRWRGTRLGSRPVEAVRTPTADAVSHGTWHWTTDAVFASINGNSMRWSTGRELPAGRVLTAAVDRDGVAWIGMDNGLAVIDPATSRVTRIESLAGGPVLSVLQDREGNHWVGTETTGLHLLRRLGFRSEAALAGKPITSVAQTTDGAIWAGTREEGLSRWKDGVWTHPVVSGALTSPVVLCLAADSHGGLWVGTPDGLNLVEASAQVRRFTSADGLPDDYIRSLEASADGSVWAGTRHGLAHLQGSVVTTVTTADGLAGDLIGAMLLVPAGRRSGQPALWVSTNGGLSQLVTGTAIRNTGLTDGPDRIVTALAADGASGLWMATRDGALSLVKDGRVQAAVAPARASSRGNSIESMIVDRFGTLWLRMNRGVRSIALGTLRRCVSDGPCGLDDDRFVRFERQDGLPSDETVAGAASRPALAMNGELWFPTRGGLAVTQTRAEQEHIVPPPVLVQGVTIDDRPQPFEAGPLTMAFGHERLTIDYAALTFIAPADVRYRFWLEGFDRTWSDAGTHRTATFTNLPPGRYTFHVQARLRDGAWSEDRASLHLRVVPPFYRRWWFLLLAVVALLGVLASLYILRLRRLRQQFNAVLAERNRIAREIHDTLTQDFVGTSLQLDLVAHQLGRGQVEKALQQVKATRQLVSAGLDEARQSIWELRANNAEDSLPARLTRLVQRESFAALAATLHVGGAYRPLEPRTERELLRITQEALSNVQRHAHATQTHVELFYSREAVLLAVRDDGVGFMTEEAAAKEGHFGLVGMRERASVIGGILDVATEAGRGTKVTVRVPVERENKSS